MSRGVLAMMLIAALTFISAEASAHRGPLNKRGCHTNPKTKVYHCHRPRPPAPIPPPR